MGGANSKAPSVFNHYTTAAEVVKAFQGTDVRGKTVLVTGARYSQGGIGWETARVLATAGAHVVLGCRSQALCDEAANAIRDAVPGAEASAFVVDLSDLKSVKSAAQKYVSSKQPLHVLINNAGIMACPLSKTKDGFEMQFGTNHLVSSADMCKQRLGPADVSLCTCPYALV